MNRTLLAAVVLMICRSLAHARDDSAVGTRLLTIQMVDNKIGVWAQDGNIGAYVYDLAEGGAADDAGIVIGDTIVSVEGKNVSCADDLWRYLNSGEPTRAVAVAVSRGGRPVSRRSYPVSHPSSNLEEVARAVCEGQPLEHFMPLATSNLVRAYSNNPAVVPIHIQAADTSQLHYVICFLSDTDVFTDKCKYNVGIFNLGFSQVVWNLRIVNVKTGEDLAARKIKGPRPECPSGIHVRIPGGPLPGQDPIGQPPNASDASTWVASVLESILSGLSHGK